MAWLVTWLLLLDGGHSPDRLLAAAQAFPSLAPVQEHFTTPEFPSQNLPEPSLTVDDDGDDDELDSIMRVLFNDRRVVIREEISLADRRYYDAGAG